LSAVSKGRVDVQVAESGIALYMELAPLLSRVGEKEQVVTDVMSNLTFDLSKFFVAYEGGAFSGLLETRWIPQYGEKIPLNRKQRFDELMKLHAAGILPGSYVRSELRKMGYEFAMEDTAVEAEIVREKMLVAQVNSDITGVREDIEMTGEEDTEE
jgi:hypothetical protein